MFSSASSSSIINTKIIILSILIIIITVSNNNNNNQIFAQTFDFAAFSSSSPFVFPDTFISFTNEPTSIVTSPNADIVITNLKTQKVDINDMLRNGISLRFTESTIGFFSINNQIVGGSSLRVDHSQIYFLRSTRQGCVGSIAEVVNGRPTCMTDSWLNDSTIEIDNNNFLQQESFLPASLLPTDDVFTQMDNIIYLPMNISSSKYVYDTRLHKSIERADSDQSLNTIPETRILIHHNYFQDNDLILVSNETGKSSGRSMSKTIRVGETRIWCPDCFIEVTMNLGCDLIAISNNTFRDRIADDGSIGLLYALQENIGRTIVEGNRIDVVYAAHFKMIHYEFIQINNTIRHLLELKQQQSSSALLLPSSALILRNNSIFIQHLNFQVYVDRRDADSGRTETELYDNHCEGITVRPIHAPWLWPDQSIVDPVINNETGEVTYTGVKLFWWYLTEFSMVDNTMVVVHNDDGEANPPITNGKLRACSITSIAFTLNFINLLPNGQVQSFDYRIESMKILDFSRNVARMAEQDLVDYKPPINIQLIIPMWNHGMFRMNDNLVESNLFLGTQGYRVALTSIIGFDEVHFINNTFLATGMTEKLSGFSFYTFDSSVQLRLPEEFSSKMTGFRFGNKILINNNYVGFKYPERDHASAYAIGAIVELRHSENVSIIEVSHNTVHTRTIISKFFTKRNSEVSMGLQLSGMRVLFSGRNVGTVALQHNNITMPGSLSSQDLPWSDISGEFVTITAGLMFMIGGYGTSDTARSKPEYSQPAEFLQSDGVESITISHNYVETAGISTWNTLSQLSSLFFQTFINSDHIGRISISSNIFKMSHLALCPNGLCNAVSLQFGGNFSGAPLFEVNDNSFLFDQFVYSKFFHPKQLNIEKEYFTPRIAMTSFMSSAQTAADIVQAPGFPIRATTKYLYNTSIGRMEILRNTFKIDGSYSSNDDLAGNEERIVPVTAHSFAFGGQMNFLDHFLSRGNKLISSSTNKNHNYCVSSFQGLYFNIIQIAANFANLNVPITKTTGNVFYAKRVEISDMKLISESVDEAQTTTVTTTTSSSSKWCFENFASFEPPARFGQIVFPSYPLIINIDQDLVIRNFDMTATTTTTTKSSSSSSSSSSPEIISSNSLMKANVAIIGAARSSNQLSRFISFIGTKWRIGNNLILDGVHLPRLSTSSAAFGSMNEKRFIFFETTPVENPLVERLASVKVGAGSYPKEIHITNSEINVTTDHHQQQPSSGTSSSSAFFPPEKYEGTRFSVLDRPTSKFVIQNSVVGFTDGIVFNGMLVGGDDENNSNSTNNNKIVLIDVRNSNIEIIRSNNIGQTTTTTSGAVFNISSRESPATTINFYFENTHFRIPASAVAIVSDQRNLNMNNNNNEIKTMMNATFVAIVRSASPSSKQQLRLLSSSVSSQSSLAFATCLTDDRARVCEESFLFKPFNDRQEERESNNNNNNDDSSSTFKYKYCSEEQLSDSAPGASPYYSPCGDIPRPPTESETIVIEKPKPKEKTTVEKAITAISATNTFMSMTSGGAASFGARKRGVLTSVDSILEDDCGFTSEYLLDPPDPSVAPLQLFFGNKEEEEEAQGGYATGAVVGNMAIIVVGWSCFVIGYYIFYKNIGERREKKRAMKEKNKKIVENNRKNAKKGISSTKKLITDWSTVKIPRKKFMDYVLESQSIYWLVFSVLIFIDPMLTSTFAVIALPQVGLGWKAACGVITGFCFVLIIFALWRLLFKRRDCERFERPTEDDEKSDSDSDDDSDEEEADVEDEEMKNVGDEAEAVNKNNNQEDNENNNNKTTPASKNKNNIKKKKQVSTFKCIWKKIKVVYDFLMDPEGEYEGPTEEDIGKKFSLVQEKTEDGKPKKDDDDDKIRNNNKKITKNYVVVTAEDVHMYKYCEPFIMDYTDRFKRFIIIDFSILLMFPIASLLATFAGSNCIVEGSVVLATTSIYCGLILFYRPNEERLMRWACPMFSLVESIEIILALVKEESVVETDVARWVLLVSSVMQMVVAGFGAFAFLLDIYDMFKEAYGKKEEKNPTPPLKGHNDKHDKGVNKNNKTNAIVSSGKKNDEKKMPSPRSSDSSGEKTLLSNSEDTQQLKEPLLVRSNSPGGSRKNNNKRSSSSSSPRNNSNHNNNEGERNGRNRRGRDEEGRPPTRSNTEDRNKTNHSNTRLSSSDRRRQHRDRGGDDYHQHYRSHSNSNTRSNRDRKYHENHQRYQDDEIDYYSRQRSPPPRHHSQRSFSPAQQQYSSSSSPNRHYNNNNYYSDGDDEEQLLPYNNNNNNNVIFNRAGRRRVLPNSQPLVSDPMLLSPVLSGSLGVVGRRSSSRQNNNYRISSSSGRNRDRDRDRLHSNNYTSNNQSRFFDI